MKSKKILLIYPIISPRIKYHWLPTSLLMVSSKLVKEGFKIKIIDERILKPNKFKEQILNESNNTLLVGLSVMTGYQIERAIKVSKLIKKYNPQLPILWGGDHPSIAPLQVINLPFVDFVIKGQGEEAIFELVTKILSGKNDYRSIKGLYFKEKLKVIINRTRPFTDIDNYYPLPYYLLNIKAYINPKTRVLNYYSSAGCAPGKCAFCNTASNYHGWKAVQPNKVVTQITQLIGLHKIKNLQFQDSNFFVSEERVKKICQLMIKNKLHLTWKASGRADQLLRYGDKTLDLIFKAGCRSIFIGMESGSQRMLNKMCKVMKANCMVKFAKKIAHLPIDLHLSLIFGLPGETINDLKITARRVKEIKNINPHAAFQKCFFTPYPNTPFFDEAIKLGYKPPQNIHDWIRVEESNQFVNVPWMPDKIKKEYQRIFNKAFAYDSAKTKYI